MIRGTAPKPKNKVHLVVRCGVKLGRLKKYDYRISQTDIKNDNTHYKRYYRRVYTDGKVDIISQKKL